MIAQSEGTPSENGQCDENGSKVAWHNQPYRQGIWKRNDVENMINECDRFIRL